MYALSLSAHDDVDATVGEDAVAHLADLKLEGSIFEGLLHLTAAKCTEVTSVGGTAALRVFRCDLLEVFHGLDLVLEVIDVLFGFFEGASDWLFAVAIVGVSGTNVFLEDVTAPYLLCHCFGDLNLN
jgi:hypothetical protein